MDEISNLKISERISSLRAKTVQEKRFLSIEQAKIITRVYMENETLPVCLKRAKSLAQSLREIQITIDPEELIVGNRTSGIRSGVVFPEAGISWLGNEINTLHLRPQDQFSVKSEDISCFREVIEPFWRDRTLEDHIYSDLGDEIKAIGKVVKINQKDHAQGHICPDVRKWLESGPAGQLKVARERLERAGPRHVDFYKSVILSLEASCDFILRYSYYAEELSELQSDPGLRQNLKEISVICANISHRSPESFREALQSVWFLFVILHMESNASSFSPGRMDQYLYPYFLNDIMSGKINAASAVELIDALYIKFNQIVYLRNAHSAKYFAGFPIGFNITIGGQDEKGNDAVNDLTYIFLKAQDHVRLPQPNLTARLFRFSSGKFIDECTRVISLGTGMPQIVNDESIIPALESSGICKRHAGDYAVVGCVELSTQGNFLGWSDAAMFNMVKALELAINNGKCMLTGEQAGPETGFLTSFSTYHAFEEAFAAQMDFFMKRMIKICEQVERIHQLHLPSPFLSSVIDDCLEAGLDVTEGGALYNFSGIQAIQVANIADSLAALKHLVFDLQLVKKDEMLEALLCNFSGKEVLRQICLNKVPKYGNDIASVDDLGSEWVAWFAERLKSYTNLRGGKYHMGLYTVSAHVPMGSNVGATPDGRFSQSPLADGGVSPMYGRDKTGPTAVLNSVSRLPFSLAQNGTLLNMKFLPSFFRTINDRKKFSDMLRVFTDLKIHHVQFNVLNSEDLLKAKSDPDSYRGLTVRVAGYTAYFTELAGDLQNEIIQRTAHGDPY